METQGDIMIRGLWYRHYDTIIDITLIEDDTYTYRFEPMEDLLARWEKIKKDKHGMNRHNQRKHISPFFLSIYDMLGREALVILKNLSRLMSSKMDETISYVRSWINSRITIAVSISYSSMICGARLPSSLQDWELDWDLALGIGLAH